MCALPLSKMCTLSEIKKKGSLCYLAVYSKEKNTSKPYLEHFDPCDFKTKKLPVLTLKYSTIRNYMYIHVLYELHFYNLLFP